MPVIDLNEPWEESVVALTACDVCIVGTGPAGATLARELSGTSLRVTLLESGGFSRSAKVDRLNEVENVGWPRNDDQWSVRNRIVGGSSHTWGGRCAPFDEVDFEERSWVPESGWPFAREHVQPYLERSATYLGLVAGDGYSGEGFWSIAGKKRPSFLPQSDVLLPFFWQFSSDEDKTYPFEYTRFGRSLTKKLGANITLVVGATALRVNPIESGMAVQSVDFAAPDGRRKTLSASVVVLCAGGIENARLLLLSNAITPNGLGNERDLVGRYLMDHPRGAVGSFRVRGSEPLQKRFGRYNVRGNLFRAGLRLSPVIQRSEKLLNCAAWLGEVLAPDDPWEPLKRILGGKPQFPGDVVSVTTNAGFLVRGIRDYFVNRNGVPRKLANLELICMCEQRPDRDSRVTLSDRTDEFGMRQSRIDWRVHEDESRTMRRMAELMVQQLPRMQFPSPILEDWVLDGAGIPSTFLDAAHPTSTTRMSIDRTKGVVDADCCVHGVDGLYVAGSSIFPTAGHCNPTQMIVALALRLADHIKLRLAA